LKEQKMDLKHELKRDVIADYVRQGIDLIKLHKENALITLAIVAAIVILVPLYLQRRASNYDRAQEMLTTGDFYARQKVYKVGAESDAQSYVLFHTTDEKFKKTQETYQQILNLYPGSPAAEDATFKIAACLYEEKKYDQALDQYRSYLNRYRKGKFVAQTNLGIACALEQKKDYAMAIESLQKVADDKNAGPWAVEALYHQGLCWEKQRSSKKAHDVFGEIEKSYPNTYWAFLAAEKTGNGLGKDESK